MVLSDRITLWLASLDYALGTAAARRLLRRVGPGSHVALSVRYWRPSRVWVGANCEIRQGTFLDGRSERDVAIRIRDGVRIKDYVGLAAYGGEIDLGDNVLVGRCSTIFGHGGVFVGADSMLSPYTMLVSSNYLACLDGVPFQYGGFTREAIHIGANVWIGAHVCVLAGSVIDSNVVVASGAVVRGNLKSGWLYGGIPAAPLKPLDASKSECMKTFTRDWGLF